jgi:hypothetical protein
MFGFTPPGSSNDQSVLPNVVQIAIALYFLVQGLEHTSAGQRPGTLGRKCWDKIFPVANET